MLMTPMAMVAFACIDLDGEDKLPTAKQLLRIAESHRANKSKSEQFCKAYFAVGELESALKELPSPAADDSAPLNRLEYFLGYELFSRRTGKTVPEQHRESYIERECRRSSVAKWFLERGDAAGAIRASSRSKSPTDDKLTDRMAQSLSTWMVSESLVKNSKKLQPAVRKEMIAEICRRIKDEFVLLPSHESYANLASLAIEQRQYDFAAELINALERKSPTFHPARDVASKLWFDLGDRIRSAVSARATLAAGERYFARSLKTESAYLDLDLTTYSDSLAAAAVGVRRLGREIEAGELFRAAAEMASSVRDPRSRRWALCDLAKRYCKEGLWDRVEEITRLGAMREQLPYCYVELARVARDAHLDERAREYLHRAENAIVDSSSSLHDIASLWAKLDDISSADRVHQMYFTKPRIMRGDTNGDLFGKVFRVDDGEKHDDGKRLATPAEIEVSFIELLIAAGCFDEAWKRLRSAKGWSKKDLADVYVTFSLKVAQREIDDQVGKPAN